MSRRKTNKEQVRNIQKVRETYTVSLPIELVRELGWRERQRVVVEKFGKNRLIISDYSGKE